MLRVGLVACSKSKRTGRSRAEDLYTGALFRKSRRYVRRHCDAWAILSAKYGLLLPGRLVEPYEKTLNTMSARRRRTWARFVRQAIHREWPRADFVVLAGARYREAVAGLPAKFPLAGLSLGRQLQWLKRRVG
jgi:hypothetical protein